MTGTFVLAKKVGGDYDLFSPAVVGATYTVTASWPAAPGLEAGSVELVLNADNDFALPSGVDLPAGTVVTLSEAVPSGTGPSSSGVRYWSGTGLTVHDNGTASFTIGDGTDPVFTVTNPSTELTGSFSVLKQVTGDGASYLDPTTGFTVEYSYPGLAEPGTLTVLNGQTVAGPDLPVGTVVTGQGGRPDRTGCPPEQRGAPRCSCCPTASGPLARPPSPSSRARCWRSCWRTRRRHRLHRRPRRLRTPPPTTPTIPNTGVNVAGASFTGFGLLIVGIAMVLLAGTRRSRGRHNCYGSASHGPCFPIGSSLACDA